MPDPAYELKTVDRIVAVLNNGDENAEATRLHSEIMDRLANNIQEHGGKHKATLTLTIEYSADPKGIDVSLVCKAKVPAKPIQKERFFMSEKNTLTLQDPARDSMFAGSDLGRAPRRVGGDPQ